MTIATPTSTIHLMRMHFFMLQMITSCDTSVYLYNSTIPKQSHRPYLQPPSHLLQPSILSSSLKLTPFLGSLSIHYQLIGNGSHQDLYSIITVDHHHSHYPKMLLQFVQGAQSQMSELKDLCSSCLSEACPH